ncbi:hypothetical protein BS47DRAFT_112200 [Hydnum rufescens UP504]|uniref:Uncharacterized protein n=1 Tax=Hydnum rufescens UP504 TaxID=1448309 RepID=A0A9P6AS68_9AGAM|nr:hypothetical protein BS47DRAFT_112200 [Hydnum rufescens UP504]
MPLCCMAVCRESLLCFALARETYQTVFTLSQYLSDVLILMPKIDWLITLLSVAMLTLVFSLGDNSSSALSPSKSIPRNLMVSSGL